MIAASTPGFFAISREAAKKFLQTVVIVDDFAGFGPYSEVVSGDRVAVPPRGRGHLEEPESPDASHEPTDASDQSQDETRPHFLNAKSVIDAFASRCIVCCVLKPTKEEMEDLPIRLAGIANRTDVLVLDWQLHNDNGKRVLAILRSMLKPERVRYPGRLQLVAIYTGERGVEEILTRIKDESGKEVGVPMEPEGHKALRWPGGRVVVLVKPESKVDPQYIENVVPFEDLVERLIDEFTNLTMGLVSNVVIAGLAQIRNNAARILCRFSQGIDAAYLSHRFMLPEPEDAEVFLTGMVQGVSHSCRV